VRKLFLIILALFSITAITSEASAAEYRVLAQKNDKNVAYEANDFYSIYYVYFNVIQALDIENRVAEKDVKKIIFQTIDNLKSHRFSQLQVEGYPGPEPLRVTLRTDIIPKDNEKILWLISNYSHEKKAVVTGKESKRAYGTYFYLVGDKLVKYQIMKQSRSENEIAAMPVNTRAEYYLLDASAENDSKGKQLLINALSMPAEQSEQVAMNITLMQYHLLDGNLKGAEARLNKARDVLREMPRKERKKLRELFHHARELVELYSEYRNRK
jgi:hypothetical protein